MSKQLLIECESALTDAIYYAEQAAELNEKQLGVADSGHRNIANRFRDLQRRIHVANQSMEAA